MAPDISFWRGDYFLAWETDSFGSKETTSYGRFLGISKFSTVMRF